MVPASEIVGNFVGELTLDALRKEWLAPWSQCHCQGGATYKNEAKLIKRGASDATCKPCDYSPTREHSVRMQLRRKVATRDTQVEVQLKVTCKPTPTPGACVVKSTKAWDKHAERTNIDGLDLGMWLVGGKPGSDDDLLCLKLDGSDGRNAKLCETAQKEANSEEKTVEFYMLTKYVVAEDLAWHLDEDRYVKGASASLMIVRHIEYGKDDGRVPDASAILTAGKGDELLVYSHLSPEGLSASLDGAKSLA